MQKRRRRTRIERREDEITRLLENEENGLADRVETMCEVTFLKYYFNLS